MKIPIKTNVRGFYKTLIAFLSSIKPIEGLVPKELNILAEILYQNYVYKNIPVKDRHIMIFSTENRIEMQKNLGMSEGSFNDYLSKIRKKGVLSRNNEIPPILNILPDNNNYEFLIKFTINE